MDLIHPNSHLQHDNKKPTEFNTNKYTCFGFGEQGHIKAKCPNKESQEKRPNKKIEKKSKSKKAYIAWDVNDVSSSSSSSSEEE